MKSLHKLLFFLILIGLFSFWTYKGIVETGIHVDLARDLNYLSDIWIHKVVWLGPMTSANFPTPPLYYYLLFPGLLLSGGNGLSVIISHAFFALLALGVFAYFQFKKSFVSTLFPILTIGLSSWWITSSSLPWNGHMYVPFVLLALTSLYFKAPIFLSAFLFGISIAINPVAIFALPVLFYEWWVSISRIKNLLYIIAGLALLWLPIFIFEIITKGFLTRQWLQYPSAAGLTFSPNSGNINQLVNIIGISQALAIVVWFIAFWVGSKRERYWMVFVSLPLILLTFVSPLRQYYLLGLVCALVFTSVTILSSRAIGKILLIVIIVGQIQTISLPSYSPGGRSIQRLDHIVNTFIKNNDLDKTKKYAVVSVIDLQNSTPQADDYRFFLRTKGINALSINEYPQADILLLFIEIPQFSLSTFEDWHVQRFGSRKFLSNQNIDGIEIIMYGKGNDF